MMMAEHSFFQYFRQTLPESAQTWVAVALRQTPVVWQSLQDPAFAQQVFLQLDSDPYLWTPGRLALIALDIKFANMNLDGQGSIVVDSQLLRKARKALENLCEAYNPAAAAFEKLQQAV
jgi:hypothetical protein